MTGPSLLSAGDLRALGELLYGEHWQSPLAAAIGVNARSIRFWSSPNPETRREIPAGAAADILALARRRHADLGAWLARTG